VSGDQMTDMMVEYDPMIATMVWTSAHKNGTHVDILKYPTVYTAASTNPTIDDPMTANMVLRMTNPRGMRAARVTLFLEKTRKPQKPVNREVRP